MRPSGRDRSNRREPVRPPHGRGYPIVPVLDQCRPLIAADTQPVAMLHRKVPAEDAAAVSGMEVSIQDRNDGVLQKRSRCVPTKNLPDAVAVRPVNTSAGKMGA